MVDPISSSVESASANAMVDNLVTQFSNALDCFRELAQNSIDAGSERIEVWTEFEASEGHEGTIALHVDDFGEGMDKHIIDNQLTKLFASAKEGDLTKIGKFGIGFVSVFALDPKAILVHTGRGGEYWEVLFHEDRSFSTTAIENPVEGTQITLYLTGDPIRYQELVEGIEANLRRWCAYSDTEIFFEDRTPIDGGYPRQVSINEEFVVEGELMILHDAPDGTQVVMAFHEEPSYGFYNRGLTLAFTDAGDNVFSMQQSRAMSQISMRIKSRYLEHTLSRDTVVRDANYIRAMAHVKEAQVRLVSKLVNTIGALNEEPNWEYSDFQRYIQLTDFLANESLEGLDLMDAKLFRGLTGKAYSANELWKRIRKSGRILVAHEPSELIGVLEGQQIPVVLGDPGGDIRDWDRTYAVHDASLSAATRLMVQLIANRENVTIRGFFRGFFVELATWASDCVVHPESVYLPVDVCIPEDEDIEALVADAGSLLRQVGDHPKLATFRPTSPEAPLFVLGMTHGRLVAKKIKQGRHIAAAVNIEHPHFCRILALYRSSKRAMAAYCLARAISLENDRGMLYDNDNLVAAAMKLEAKS